jgi:hypothetical protein
LKPLKEADLIKVLHNNKRGKITILRIIFLNLGVLKEEPKLLPQITNAVQILIIE